MRFLALNVLSIMLCFVESSSIHFFADSKSELCKGRSASWPGKLPAIQGYERELTRVRLQADDFQLNELLLSPDRGKRTIIRSKRISIVTWFGKATPFTVTSLSFTTLRKPASK